MILNIELLENVRPKGDGFDAACPACREAGKDRAGDNLRVWDGGGFNCIVGSDDPDHRAAIIRIAGAKGSRPDRFTPRRESRIPTDWMPDFDAARRQAALDSVGPFSLGQLRASSPWPNPEQLSPTRALSLLFRAIWTPLCWAPKPWIHRVVPIYMMEDAERCECVSASSPAGSGALTPRDGRPSPACEDNFPTRHFLVTEFDSGPLDEQAALIEHLRRLRCARLAAVVFSGSKSLHAWWDFRGRPEPEAIAFLRVAVMLGADPAFRKRSQRTRTPNALRDGNGVGQTCLFLEPSEVVR